MNTRKKGYRLENETVNWMKARNINFKRIRMSGQLTTKTDFSWVENGTEYFGDAKSGSQVPKSLYDWLEKDKADFLVLRADRKNRLWVLTDKMLEVLIK